MEATLIIHNECIPEGICSICRKKMTTHHKIINQEQVSGGLQEIELRIAHSKCESLLDRRNKILRRLLEVDYRLFVRTQNP